MNKGGSTKTTTAVHLAAALAKEGSNVLLIDTDEQADQGNVATHLGLNREQAPKTLYDFIINGDKDAIYEARENLYVIRGGFELNKLRRNIDQRQLGGHLVFTESLEPIEHLFDYIILDTPPSWNSLNINGLFYADEIVIPINLEGMTISNLHDYIKRNLSEIQKYRSAPLKWGYALPTRFDRRVSQSGELLGQLSRFFDTTISESDELSKRYSKTVLCEPIRYNVRISEAAGHGQTVFEYDPKSNGALDYINFARKVNAR